MSEERSAVTSITTLTRITSKIAKIHENTFLNSVFKSLNTNQNLCVVLHEVKRMLLYRGGSIFGKSVDGLSSLALTILGIDYLPRGIKFLSKMLPVSKLTSQFLIGQVTATTQAISSGGGQVKA